MSNKYCEKFFGVKFKRVLSPVTLNLLGRRKVCFSFLYISIMGIFICPSLSHAEVWEIKPRVTLQERYDDNFKLESAPHDSIAETMLRGVVSFSRLSETSKVVGRVHARLSNQSKDDQYITFVAQKKRELSQWMLSGFLRQDTTIRTVNANQDVGGDSELVVDDVDDGQIQLELRRSTVRLKPKFTHQINERTTLGVAYLFKDISYKNNTSDTGVFDYNQNGIAGSIVHNLSERDTVTTILGLSRFQSADNINTVSNSLALTVGYKRLFSERFYGNVAVGIRHSNISSDVQDSEVNTLVLRAQLYRKFESGRAKIEALRDVQPSGAGYQTETTQLKLKLTRRLKERLSGVVNLRGIERKSVGTFLSDKSYYLDIASSLSWELNRWWSVGAGYNFRKREKIDSPNDAYGNAVFVSLTYAKRVAID